MRRIASVVAAVTVMAMGVAPPADAASGGEFECSMTLMWPGSGSTDPCVGSATGSFGQLLCIPECSFSLSVDFYSSSCDFDQPPVEGQLSGSILISNGAQSISPQYSMTVVGTVLILTTSGPVGFGVGSFMTEVPVPSCQDHSLRRVDLRGLLFFV